MAHPVIIFTSPTEVLVFEYDGSPIGGELYFKPEGDRDPEDYDVCLGELPLQIDSSIRAEPNRVLIDNMSVATASEIRAVAPEKEAMAHTCATPNAVELAGEGKGQESDVAMTPE